MLKVHSWAASITTDPAREDNYPRKGKRRANPRETDWHFMTIREGENWMIPTEQETESKRSMTPLGQETGQKLI